MKAIVRNVEGLTFIGRAKSNHWMTFDGPKDFNGAEAASRPMEGLLISLGACTGSDVRSMLDKMRVPVTKFEIELDSEREHEHPKVFKWIKISYKFWGKNLEEYTEKIEKAINLSQDKYCPISAMLKHSVQIDHEYTLHEEE
ncbi:MAG: OsmC family protein [Calditrichia bacterium]